ncbi:MAG: hypothetical protein IJW41_03830 [Oscillospiraceae bacterium]|nr:hypothetical protein [Oscillospiraceae bacterium]
MGLNSGCSGCSGGCCESCGSLTLGPDEVAILRNLGQIPFWPIARKADDMTPVYREDDAYPEEVYSILLTLLEKKGLISLDYDKPLGGFDMTAYRDLPVHGSLALTARGQQVLESLDIQGV